MTKRQRTAMKRLAGTAAGPRLSRALAELEQAELSGSDRVTLLQAQYRQLAHEQARLLRALDQIGQCGVPVSGAAEREADAHLSAIDEIRAALVLTRRSAESQYDVAVDLLHRLPKVFAALEAGELDLPRARLLSEWTGDLPEDAARELCERLLPVAARLTTGQLIERIKRAAIRLDPEWAQRRYETAVAERRVLGERNPDGSANLLGLNLPVERTADACAHITDLAQAAKRGGDPRPVDHVRAEIFLGLTDGSCEGLDAAGILAWLRGQRGDAGTPQHRVVWATGIGRDVDARPGAPGQSDAAAAEHPRETGQTSAAGEIPATGGQRPLRAEMRVQLSVLLDHSCDGAELVGWGAIAPPQARQLAEQMRDAHWRYVLIGADRQILTSGSLRVRPIVGRTCTPGSKRHRSARRGTVEILVPESELDQLLADGPEGSGAWWPVVEALQRARNRHTREPGTDDGTSRDDDSDEQAPPTSQARLPGIGMRRRLWLRDQYCTFPGCRAPASHTQADHTDDYANGGATSEDNLGSLCAHDHELKSSGGWQLQQPEPGHFLWTSPLGRRYRVRPPPVLPDPFDPPSWDEEPPF